MHDWNLALSGFMVAFLCIILSGLCQVDSLAVNLESWWADTRSRSCPARAAQAHQSLATEEPLLVAVRS